MKHGVQWGFLALGGFAFYGAPAHAEGDFGRAGTIAISAERLFGLTLTSVVQEQAGNEVTDRQTVFSVLNDVSPSGSAGDPLANGYTNARIGLDYFVIPSLSVGGSLGFATFSSGESTEMDGGTEDQDGPSGNGIVFAARAGYAYMFTPIVGLWPRAGLTYMGAHGENASGSFESGGTAWALTLEVPLVIAPIPHVAFLVCPFWDIGLAGSREQTLNNAPTESVDTTTHALGVQAAVTGYF